MYNMVPRKTRQLDIDFIRALCAVGIIVYHFYCEVDDHLTRFFVNFAVVILEIQL